jgi:hypothetical protein
MQRDVAGFDASHEVGARDTDQISGLLGRQNGINFGAATGRMALRALQQGRATKHSSEVALDQTLGARRQLDVTTHHLDQRINLDPNRQGRRPRLLGCSGGFSSLLHSK